MYLKNKIVCLFNCGESINEHIEEIKEILKNQNIIKVGINLFPIKFKDLYYPNLKEKSIKTDYWVASDTSAIFYISENYNQQNLILNSLMNEEEYEVLNNSLCKVKCLFNHTNECNLEDNNYLYGDYSTALKTIHYFLKKGCKVVVVGMDNKCNENGEWLHFYPHKYEWEANQKPIHETLEINFQIQKLNKIGEIYKVSNNNINVPLIDIKELINERVNK